MSTPAIPLGTVSHGTLNPLHLVDAFMAVLEHHAPEVFDEVLGNGGDTAQAWRLNWRASLLLKHEEDLNTWLNEDIFPAMEELAEEHGCWFGNTEGDGSDFGFWDLAADTDEEDV